MFISKPQLNTRLFTAATIRLPTTPPSATVASVFTYSPIDTPTVRGGTKYRSNGGIHPYRYKLVGTNNVGIIIDELTGSLGGTVLPINARTLSINLNIEVTDSHNIRAGFNDPTITFNTKKYCTIPITVVWPTIVVTIPSAKLIVSYNMDETANFNPFIDANNAYNIVGGASAGQTFAIAEFKYEFDVESLQRAFPAATYGTAFYNSISTTTFGDLTIDRNTGLITGHLNNQFIALFNHIPGIKNITLPFYVTDKYLNTSAQVNIQFKLTLIAVTINATPTINLYLTQSNPSSVSVPITTSSTGGVGPFTYEFSSSAFVDAGLTLVIQSDGSVRVVRNSASTTTIAATNNGSSATIIATDASGQQTNITAFIEIRNDLLLVGTDQTIILAAGDAFSLYNDSTKSFYNQYVVSPFKGASGGYPVSNVRDVLLYSYTSSNALVPIDAATGLITGTTNLTSVSTDGSLKSIFTLTDVKGYTKTVTHIYLVYPALSVEVNTTLELVGSGTQYRTKSFITESSLPAFNPITILNGSGSYAYAIASTTNGTITSDNDYYYTTNYKLNKQTGELSSKSTVSTVGLITIGIDITDTITRRVIKEKIVQIQVKYKPLEVTDNAVTDTPVVTVGGLTSTYTPFTITNGNGAYTYGVTVVSNSTSSTGYGSATISANGIVTYTPPTTTPANMSSNTHVKITATVYDNALGSSSIHTYSFTKQIWYPDVVVGSQYNSAISIRRTLSAGAISVNDTTGGSGSFSYSFYDAGPDKIIHSSPYNGLTLVASTNTKQFSIRADNNATIGDSYINVAVIDSSGRAKSSYAAVLIKITVGEANYAPTGEVTITGSSTKGATLSVTSTLADADGIGTLHYQWYANGSPIGTDSYRYTTTANEVDKNIICVVTYTDNLGNRESVSSLSFGPITATPVQQAGIVVVTGTRSTGNTLTATVSDGNVISGTVAWVWVGPNGTAVSTGNTCTPTTAGSYTVTATYNDSLATNQTASLTFTETLSAASNHAGTIAITGTTSTGNILTATLTDSDTVSGNVSWTWSNASGSVKTETTGTSSTYTPTVAGTYTVTALYNDSLKPEQLATANVTVTTAIAVNTAGIITITGTKSTGNALSATVTDADEIRGNVIWVWKLGATQVKTETIASSASSSYTPTTAGPYTVTANYDDVLATNQIATATFTEDATVVANNLPTGTVTIAGNLSVGSIITATNNLADVDGLGTLHYQWKSGTTNVGTNSTTYTTVAGDIGNNITCVVTYTDNASHAESVTSNSLGPIVATITANNLPTGTVTIAGNLSIGSIITATNDLADADGLGTLHYQWKSGTTNVGTDATTYTTVASDIGNNITCVVTYTDNASHAESVTSNSLGPITDAITANNLPTGGVTIAGNLPVGSIITATNDLADADGLGTLHYQWYSDSDLVGTDSTTYTTVAGDVDKFITCTISYTDNAGNAESVSSNSLGPVTAAVVSSHNYTGYFTTTINDLGMVDQNYNLDPVNGVFMIDIVTNDTTTGTDIKSKSYSYNFSNFSVYDNQGGMSNGASGMSLPAHPYPTTFHALRDGIVISGVATLVITFNDNTSITLTSNIEYPVPELVLTPGDAMEGGYFAGYYSATKNGVATHKIIVAPKIYDGKTPGITTGYTDWRRPTRWQLMICYYYLKPTTDKNATANNRYSFVGGDNPYAVLPYKTKTLWTANFPAQTKVSIFKAGGSEAFTTNHPSYGSMHQANPELPADNGYVVWFLDGSHHGDQSSPLRSILRCIRLVPI